MIFPLLPLFLTSLPGAGPAALGIIEGIADAAAAILKYVFGARSDRLARRKPYIVGGYALAAISRLAIPLAGAWTTVLGARLFDRVGKGMRTAPRDALICDVTPVGERGRAFGFHRAMDHTGAVIGPLVAAALLAAGLSLRSIFFIAVIPTAIAIVMLATMLVETGVPDTIERSPETTPAATAPAFRRFLVAIALFALANSSDAFLLLYAADAGIPIAIVPLLWAAHHAVKALLSTHFGAWSDRRRRSLFLVAGWLIYAAVYIAFPFARSVPALIVLFLLYALPFALTEGAEAAMVGELSPEGGRGRAFGMFAIVRGFGVLVGTIFFGLIYQRFGPQAAFHLGAGLAVAASLTLVSQQITWSGKRV